MTYDRKKAKALKKEKKYEELFEYLSSFANSDNPEALNNLSECYYFGQGVEKNHTMCFSLDSRAALTNNPDALAILGYDYKSGIGIAADIDKAIKLFRESVSMGSLRGMVYLGVCYENGIGVERDEKEAVKWYRKAAKQNYARAQCNLGTCYEFSIGVEKDVKEAVKWYRKAAEQDYARAQFNIGVCYYNGTGVERDEKEAVKWYKKAAEQDYTEAQCCLGTCYEYNTGIKKDMKEAVKWYRKAAEQGHARAQLNLGICYDFGTGVIKDEEEAVKWYKKSAIQGYVYAQYNLGVCYYNGTGVEKDQKEAFKWYRKAAEQEYTEAQCNLGTCYEFSIGVEKDEKEAVRWYKKAAEQDYARAQCNLGACYEFGIGVEKNEKEAVKWYRKSAEQGYARAQSNLGFCYENGIGVEEDEKKAIEWFENAAEQGYARAQCDLGHCYYNGIGVEKDGKEAVKWFEKAAEQDYAKAQFNLGIFYYGILGNEKNEKDYFKAVEWFRKSLLHTNSNYTYIVKLCLSFCLENGLGCDVDYAEAFSLRAEAFEKNKEESGKLYIFLKESYELEKKETFTKEESIRYQELKEKYEQLNQKIAEHKMIEIQFETVMQKLNDMDIAMKKNNGIIVEKIDRVLGTVSELSKSVVESKKELAIAIKGMTEQSEKFEKTLLDAFRNITESINSKFLNSESRFSFEEEKKSLATVFGTAWEQLDTYTKDSIVSAMVILKETKSEEAEGFDYSGVCISATSALENEVRKRFFYDLQNYLKVNNMPICNWPKQLVYNGKEDNGNSFTLGVLPYFFGFKNSNKYSKYCASEDDKLRSILEDYLKNKTGNKSITLESFKNFVEKTEKIRIAYRNPSAHTEPISKSKAYNCCNAVIGIKEVEEHNSKIIGALYQLAYLWRQI